jgi:hypothetical protein
VCKYLEVVHVGEHEDDVGADFAFIVFARIVQLLEPQGQRLGKIRPCAITEMRCRGCSAALAT